MDGSPSDIQATVGLYSFGIGSPVGIVTPRAGQVIFRGLQPAHYSVEVTVPGYQTVTQPVDLQLAGLSEQVAITPTPESHSHAWSSASTLVLAPAAVKELGKVLEDLRKANNVDAKKRLEKVSRTAPSYPDVNYLWGTYYAQIQDQVHAKEYWQKTLQEDPRYVVALAALSQVVKSRPTMEISPRQSATWSAPLVLSRRHGLTSSGSPGSNRNPPIDGMLGDVGEQLAHLGGFSPPSHRSCSAYNKKAALKKQERPF
jgi:hypothetical protein